MFVFDLKIEAEVRIQSNDSLSLSSPFRTVTQLIFKINPICYFRLLWALVIWLLFLLTTDMPLSNDVCLGKLFSEEALLGLPVTVLDYLSGKHTF